MGVCSPPETAVHLSAKLLEASVVILLDRRSKGPRTDAGATALQTSLVTISTASATPLTADNIYHTCRLDIAIGQLAVLARTHIKVTAVQYVLTQQIEAAM